MDRILIIDHDSYFLDRVQELLSDEGYRVYARDNLIESRDVIEEAELDMVIMLLSKEFDFKENIKILKEIDPNISIIGIITDELGEVVTETVNIGVDDYILKPIMNTNNLIKKIEKNLEIKQLKKTNAEQLSLLKTMNDNLNLHLRAMESDLLVGSELQKKMLPKNNYIWGNCEFSYISIPSHYLSGDFIGYQAINDDECLFYLIDVSGHGPSAAFVALMVYNIIDKYKTMIINDKSKINPSELAKLINNEINKSKINKHLVGVFGVINKKEKVIKYTNAGLSPKPVLIQNTNYDILENSSMAIGLIPKAKYITEEINLSKETRVLLMSDGVFDAIEKNTQKEKESFLMNELKINSNMNILKEHLLENKNSLIDDLTVLQIKIF